MSLEENKAIVRRLFEELNKRNLSIMDELIAPNFFHHTHQLRGLESYKQLETRVVEGFPDLHETIEDIIAEGDKVWVRYKAEGINRGEFHLYSPVIGKKMRLAPTGKKITFTVAQTLRIVDGKIAEIWGVYDLLDFLKQLGVIDYKGFPDENINNCNSSFLSFS